MTNENYTHVSFVLDMSGSMKRIKDATISGFNEFLEEQRGMEGDASISLYRFNHDVETIYTVEPIGEADELTSENYRPGGRTALHDAMHWGIEDTDSHLKALPGTEKPDKVVAVVLTDGLENASETPVSVVREKIEEKKSGGWEFLFIGANQDAAFEAGRRGIDESHSMDMDHSAEGVRTASQMTSRSVSRARREGETDGFTDSE